MDGPVIEFTAGISTDQLERMFSEAYPNLRIRLVRAHPEKLRRQGLSVLNGYAHQNGKISIMGTTTVREVISAFRDKHDITATIYRLTGNTWIPVKQTQDWSLAEQNNEGMDI